MRHPAPGRSQSAGQTPLFFNYSYLKTNKKNTLLTAKKHRDSRCLRQTGERAPAPVISLIGGFALRISMFPFPKETRLSPLEPGVPRGCLARRWRWGRLLFPGWKGNEQKGVHQRRERAGTGAPPAHAFPRPRSRPGAPSAAAARPHLTPLPRPGSLENGTRDRAFVMGKPVLVVLSVDGGWIV